MSFPCRAAAMSTLTLFLVPLTVRLLNPFVMVLQGLFSQFFMFLLNAQYTSFYSRYRSPPHRLILATPLAAQLCFRRLNHARFVRTSYLIK